MLLACIFPPRWPADMRVPPAALACRYACPSRRAGLLIRVSPAIRLHPILHPILHPEP